MPVQGCSLPFFMRDAAPRIIIYSCLVLFYSLTNKKEPWGRFFFRLPLFSTQNRGFGSVKYFSLEKGSTEEKSSKGTDLIRWTNLFFDCMTKLQNEQFLFADGVSAGKKKLH